MRFGFLVVCLALLNAAVLRATEPLVYFNAADPTSGAAAKWERVPKAEFERRTKDEPVADSYTVRTGEDGGRVVERTLATPSGDWVMIVVHRFKPDGDLVIYTTDLRTLGYDEKTQTSSPTRCLRRYVIRPDGTPLRISERVTDATSGARVTRQFFHPEATPWRKISELPLPPE
ncbi:MAG: hypothetical protein JSR82_14515 [Verrucomicrobia bacterium]|nr:hypothetical protein [Verrucomicrobiota bacterium]